MEGGKSELRGKGGNRKRERKEKKIENKKKKKKKRQVFKNIRFPPMNRQYFNQTDHSLHNSFPIFNDCMTFDITVSRFECRYKY